MHTHSLGAGKTNRDQKKNYEGNGQQKEKGQIDRVQAMLLIDEKNQSLAWVVSSTAGMKCSSAHAAHSSVNFSLTPSGSF